MADFPTSIYDPRVVENVNGVAYDVAKTKTLFAEDINLLADEVVAIEDALGANLDNIVDLILATADTTPSYIKAYQALGSSLLATCVVAGSSLITLGVALQDSLLRLIAVYLDKDSTINGVMWWQQTQGNYTADNYNGVGLYSYSAGVLTLVASSTNNGNIWKASASAYHTENFSSPYSATAGIYFIAMLYNQSAQTTAPQVGGITASVNGATNIYDFTNSGKLNGAITSQTSLPTPQNISGASTSTANVWCALV